MRIVKTGIKGSITFVCVYVLLVLFNLSCTCDPHGIARIDWLYPFKYWFVNSSGCGLHFIDVIISGIIWIIFGFILGVIISIIIKYIKKK